MKTGKHTILVVDDDALSRKILSTGVREAGYDVCEAEGGKQALALLQERPVDVLLLDLLMPEMDGFQVIERMKSNPLLRLIPIIVVSASDDMDSVVKSIEKGAVDHLSKPFDPLLLQTRIRAALALRRLQEDPGAKGEAPPQSTELLSGLEKRKRTLPEQGPTMGILEFGRRLLHWMRPYRRQAAPILCALSLSVGVAAALPLGIKFITDYGLTPPNLKLLSLILAAMVVAAIAGTAARLSWDYYYARIGIKMLSDLRFNMFRHLQRMSMGYYGRESSGDIIGRFTTDMASVEDAIMMCLPNTISQFGLLLFSIVLLFVLEWRLSLFALAGLYISYKGGRWISPKASAAIYRMKEKQAGMVAALKENIEAQPVIKTFRLQGMMIERFKSQTLDFFVTAARANFLTYMTDQVPSQSILLFGVLTLCGGALLVYYGFLTIGELVSFQMLLMGMIAAVSELTWSVPHLVRAAAGMQRIEELINEEVDISDAPDAVPLSRPEREIAFRGVQFGYKPDIKNLDDVSLTIPINKSVLLVGPSGCGKSTILRMLMRFHDPAGGAVVIDGSDIRKVTQDSLREHIGVVLQENFLFNTTIRENIRLAKRTATDDQVIEAAKAAGVHDVILGMPDGYETLVGERGGNLSGGQRQRLAIARAILSDPAVLLLDEATSALDPSSAAAINDSLEKIGRGRTVISVTHRLETAPSVDCIYVFKDGRLVEDGSHKELLDRNGLYSRLWGKQMGSRVSDDSSRAMIYAALRTNIPFVQKLDDATWEAMARLFTTENFPRQRLVFQEGDIGEKFYIIVRGRVAVSRMGPSGQERQIAVLEDGDFFGEVALIKRAPRMATIRTITDCMLLSLSAEHLLRVIDDNPGIRADIEEAVRERTFASDGDN